MLIDLHVHTRLSSCSQLSLDQILGQARHLGLDGVGLTDHHSTQARAELARYRGELGLVVLVGQEYATSQGDFLLFGPGSDQPPGLSAGQVLGLVRQAGGAAVAAHPFRPERKADLTLVGSELCPVMEALNGRAGPGENQLALRWAREHHVPACGGSDAHQRGEIGRALTFFHRPVYNEAQLARALVSGQCRPLDQVAAQFISAA